MQTRQQRSTAPARGRQWGAVLAREAAAGYDASGDPDVHHDRCGDADDSHADPVARLDACASELDAAIAAVFGLDLDQLPVGALGDLMVFASAAKDRLEALLLTVVTEQRRRARLRRTGEAGSQAAGGSDPSDGDGGRDQQHDERDLREAMRNRCRLGAGEAKRAERSARELEDSADEVTRALRAGRIRVDHARVITETAAKLVGDDQREQLIAELLAAAERLDPVALGRLARRRLGEIDPEAACRAAQREESDRYLNVRQTTRGSVRLSGELYGVGAEALLTGLRAFARPDAPDEHRTGPQRQADALEALIWAGLDRGTAPTEHGQRPHLNVLVPWQALVEGAGTAELTHLGPYPWQLLRYLLDDAVISRILFDAKGTPIEVTTQTRCVPAGLHRALLARDRGCRWKDCDLPAGFCDVAHGAVPYRDGGKLGPANAALLCRRHHRRFDLEGWQMTIDGDRVNISPPPQPSSHTTTISPNHQPGAPPNRKPGTQPRRPSTPPTTPPLF